MANVIVETENGNLVLTGNVELAKKSAHVLQELDIAEKIHADVRFCKSDNKDKHYLVLTKRIDRKSLSMESLCKKANALQYAMALIEDTDIIFQRINNYEKDVDGLEKACNEYVKKLLEEKDPETEQGQD